MRRTVLPLLLALAGGAHAEVRITDAYPTDRTGVRIAPRLGEPFLLTVTLSASNQTAPYNVKIEAPSVTFDSGPLNYAGNAWLRRGEIVPLFDGPMDVTVSCSAAKAPFNLRIVPIAPEKAIQTYQPQRLNGQLGATVVVSRKASRLLAWLPIPQSTDFQTVESLNAPVRQGLSRQTGQPIGLVETTKSDRIEATTDFSATVSSVRTNLTTLRTVPMGAVKKGAWLASESRIQSTHKEIVAFARTATKGTTTKTPVVDVALNIYSAILKRSVYSLTGAMPDALGALRNRKGECGDLSALFVATCRAAGIPARPVSGFSVGKNAWHVWAEFQVPGMGWVPVDPAYALGKRPNSAFPLYFGVVPEMRDRVGVCTGFNHTVGSQATSFLQTPQIFTFESGLTARLVDVWCRLTATDVKG